MWSVVHDVWTGSGQELHGTVHRSQSLCKHVIGRMVHGTMFLTTMDTALDTLEEDVDGSFTGWFTCIWPLMHSTVHVLCHWELEEAQEGWVIQGTSSGGPTAPSLCDLP